MVSGSFYVVQSHSLSSFCSKQLFFGAISRACPFLLLSAGVGEQVMTWTGHEQGSR